MTFSPIVDWRQSGRALTDALGLPLNTTKIVIEVETGSPVRFYATGLVGETSWPAIVQCVKDVTVRDDATVEVTPHDAPSMDPPIVAYRVGTLVNHDGTETPLYGPSPSESES